MKKRYKFFIIGLTALFLLFVGLHMWNWFELNRKIESRIRQKLATEYGNEVSLGRLQLGINTLHFSDVIYAPKSMGIKLWIEGINIDFDPIDFLLQGFKFDGTTKEILLNRPRLTFSARNKSEKPLMIDAASLARLLQPFHSAISDIVDFSHVLTVNQGEISIYYEENNHIKPLLNGLTGWIDNDEKTGAELKLAGRLASRKHNVVIESGFNIPEGRIDSLIIHLAEFELKKSQNIWESSFFKFDSGVMKSELRFYWGQDSLPKISGSAEFNNVGLTLTNTSVALKDLQIQAELVGEFLKIESGKCLINDTPVDISGTFNGFLDPLLDLNLKTSQLQVEKFANSLDANLNFPLKGQGRFEVDVKGSMETPILNGRFFADSLKLANQTFNRAVARFNAKESVLEIDEISAQSVGSDLNGWGRIYKRNDRFKVQATIIADGNFKQAINALNLVEVEAADGMVVANLMGMLNSPTVRGNFSFNLPQPVDTTFNLKGRFDVENWNLELDSYSTGHGLSIKGRIDDFLIKPVFSLRVSDLSQLGGIFSVPGLPLLDKAYRFSALVEGVPSKLNLQIDATSKKTQHDDFHFQIEVARSENEDRHIQGNIKYKPGSTTLFSTEFKAIMNDSVFSMYKIGNDKWLSGKIEFGLKPPRKIDGTVKLKNFDLARLSDKKTKEGAEKVSGQAFANFQVDGSLDRPAITADAWITNGYFNGVGDFNVVTEVTSDREGINLTKMNMKKSGSTYLTASGKYSFKDRMLDLNILGDNLDADELLQAAVDQDSIFNGKTNIDLKLKGNSWPLPLYGTVKIVDGAVRWFNFDAVNINFGDETDTEYTSSLSDSGIYASNITFVRNGEFIGRGDGLFPLNKSDSMRVSLKADGNLLALLYDVAETVKRANSSGRLDMNLVGPYKDVTLSNSRLQVYSGKVELSQVARTIDDITVQVEADRRFISIKELTGKIGGEEIRIINHGTPPTQDARTAMPLIINRDWMSLGTLQLNSSNAGLPLHIPAVMEDGEIGTFIIKGRESELGKKLGNDGFFVAGPWQNPVFWGDVVLQDVNLTYPFVETKEPVDSTIFNLILNADWDIEAIAGKDNHYIRNINYGISNFYVNLGIDDDVSRMRFAGIMNKPNSITRRNVEIMFAQNDNDLALDTLGAKPLNDGAAVYVTKGRDGKEIAGPDTSSFRIIGRVESTRGRIEYLDLVFRVEKFGAGWDRSELQPVVYGKAWTTIPDTANTSQNVYSQDVALKVYARDPSTGNQQSNGRFENIFFDLESSNPLYNHSKVHLLAALGISFDNVRGHATDIITNSTDKVLFRQLLRPVERTLEKSLGLDMVRLQSRFTRNFLEMNQGRTQGEATLSFLRSTRLSVGKYLTSRIYLLYTGQVAAWPVNYKFSDPNIGLRHTVDFEFRIRPSLLLQMEYDYNNTLQEKWREDKKIWLRHSFPFK